MQRQWLFKKDFYIFSLKCVSHSAAGKEADSGFGFHTILQQVETLSATTLPKKEVKSFQDCLETEQERSVTQSPSSPAAALVLLSKTHLFQ